ncbi:gephyrin-like molybdotransferase Glp [Rhodococcus sp. NPDC058521]|uniref:molybdopterin molybdotransferase MoeA n=1 Tax=Rhodococcus sp. NPDC058521 TaxID=3346536 RepID=UPI003668E75B
MGSEQRRSVHEHSAHVQSLLEPLLSLSSVDVSPTEALGRATAADIFSPLDLPPFRNSQMDGYAVDAASLATVPVTLPTRGVVPAGPGTPPPHAPGTAVRIMTGAVIPEGADTIVPVEDTTVDGDTVTISRGRSAGEYVREQGSDVTEGTLLVAADTVLEPRHIALLAAVGAETVSVRARPRVAIITTGTELVAAGRSLGSGEIYDSNGTALSASATANGAEVVSVIHSEDDIDTFRAVLDRATAIADVVFTSGGVSMGDFEVVKETLTTMGGEFVHVAMQPGGPQGTALVHGVPVLCFPGNPVSTLVSFEVFTRPILRQSAGLPAISRPRLALERGVTSIPGKRQLLRARCTDRGTVDTVSGPGSHLVAGLAWSNVLIDLPEEVESLAAGELVEVWPL